MKKTLFLVAVLSLAMLFSGCGTKNNDIITVLSREDGSGTRDAFESLLGIEETTLSAEISDSTAVMITSVEGNRGAVGYISLGALRENVKALKIDGIPASGDNVKNGSYKLARAFNIATKENISDSAADFISFILSSKGQAVVEQNKYISATNGGDYKPSGKTGKVTVAGSSSVAPVMEKLKEAYIKLNPKADIEIQQTDSTNGIQTVIDGICDIAMSSRELKKSELSSGLSSKAIALDGIAVIVSIDNPLDNISAEQLASIYSGKATEWSKIINN